MQRHTKWQPLPDFAANGDDLHCVEAMPSTLTSTATTTTASSAHTSHRTSPREPIAAAGPSSSDVPQAVLPHLTPLRVPKSQSSATLAAPQPPPESPGGTPPSVPVLMPLPAHLCSAFVASLDSSTPVKVAPTVQPHLCSAFDDAGVPAVPSVGARSEDSPMSGRHVAACAWCAQHTADDDGGPSRLTFFGAESRTMSDDGRPGVFLEVHHFKVAPPPSPLPAAALQELVGHSLLMGAASATRESLDARRLS